VKLGKGPGFHFIICFADAKTFIAVLSETSAIFTFWQGRNFSQTGVSINTFSFLAPQIPLATSTGIKFRQSLCFKPSTSLAKTVPLLSFFRSVHEL